MNWAWRISCALIHSVLFTANLIPQKQALGGVAGESTLDLNESCVVGGNGWFFQLEHGVIGLTVSVPVNLRNKSVAAK